MKKTFISFALATLLLSACGSTSMW
ncbi:MAG: lipoprotein [Neisseriaceae bacterium]|nr:lipoprotein [Neisseriaceae bacterium]